MSIPVDSSTVADVLGILEQIPAAGGYIIAMVGFSVFGWILAVWARSSQRSFTASQQSMQNVVKMGESLREAMRQDILRCKEECLECYRVIELLKAQQRQLVEEHTLARNLLLAEAKELRDELANMLQTVSILTTKLDNANSLRRDTDGSH